MSSMVSFETIFKAVLFHGMLGLVLSLVQCKMSYFAS